MSDRSQQPFSSRAIENAAAFGLTYTVGTVGEAVVDALYHPGVTDVPRSAVIALGLLIASATTAVVDVMCHRPGPIE